MKQLIVVVLVAALLSLGYRLAATMNADADPTPAPKEEAPKEPKPNTPIQPAAVRVDRPSAERNQARDDETGPNRTRRGDAASHRSQAVPRSAAKPLAGTNANDLATARTPPPAPPLQPRTVGPDGIVYRKVGAAPSVVATLRLTPPPAEEALVQAPPPAPPIPDDKPLSPEPLPLPRATIVPAHGKTVGPDGIEFHPIQPNR